MINSRNTKTICPLNNVILSCIFFTMQSISNTLYVVQKVYAMPVQLSYVVQTLNENYNRHALEVIHTVKSIKMFFALYQKLLCKRTGIMLNFSNNISKSSQQRSIIIMITVFYKQKYLVFFFTNINITMPKRCKMIGFAFTLYVVTVINFRISTIIKFSIFN